MLISTSAVSPLREYLFLTISGMLWKIELMLLLSIFRIKLTYIISLDIIIIIFLFIKLPSHEIEKIRWIVIFHVLIKYVRMSFLLSYIEKLILNSVSDLLLKINPFENFMTFVNYQIAEINCFCCLK